MASDDESEPQQQEEQEQRSSRSRFLPGRGPVRGGRRKKAKVNHEFKPYISKILKKAQDEKKKNEIRSDPETASLSKKEVDERVVSLEGEYADFSEHGHHFYGERHHFVPHPRPFQKRRIGVQLRQEQHNDDEQSQGRSRRHVGTRRPFESVVKDATSPCESSRPFRCVDFSVCGTTPRARTFLDTES